MRLFGGGGGGGESAEAQERREASQRSLEAGGLPLNAIDRLNEQAGRQGTAKHFFTGNLSVNELALMSQSGYEPLGQVMGSSVYHVGYQWMPGWSGSSGELSVLTQAFYNARHLALGRLRQEAALLRATGVVGVRLERKEYEWGAGLLEFAAIGTAIRDRDAEPAAQTAPFLCDLSGEDFWTLRQAGFRPVGVAVGNCTYYQVPTWSTQNAMGAGIFGGWNNQELPEYTQAVYNARSLAIGRMEDEARTEGATGIIGADVTVEIKPREIDVNNRRRIDMLYHFTAISTAIAPYDGRWPLFQADTTVSLGG
jgi:uncharacterized protein YbjQ (UPF0145 family)